MARRALKNISLGMFTLYVFNLILDMIERKGGRGSWLNPSLGLKASILLLLLLLLLLRYDNVGCLIMVFGHTAAYLTSLDDPELTELAVNEYKAATNMTDQFAALAAITQNPGKTHDEVLADFYNKWQHEFLVSSHFAAC